MLDHKSFPGKKSGAANRSKIGVAHKGEDICFQGKFSNRSQSFRPHAEGGSGTVTLAWNLELW